VDGVKALPACALTAFCGINLPQPFAALDRGLSVIEIKVTMRLFTASLLGVSLFIASGFGAADVAPAPKDEVVIDQQNVRLVGVPESATSNKAGKILIQLPIRATLAAQDKCFLRVAINLDAPESFRSVFAQEITKGAGNYELNLVAEHPKQPILRILVWLDQASGTGAPKPLASDNMAFQVQALLDGTVGPVKK
jgi:hypothetical protein